MPLCILYRQFGEPLLKKREKWRTRRNWGLKELKMIKYFLALVIGLTGLISITTAQQQEWPMQHCAPILLK